MAAPQFKAALSAADHPAPEPLSANDRLAHDMASHVRRSASAEHERTKPPLPVRPPRPHPHAARTAAVR